MKISNDGSCNSGLWESFVSPKAWTLSSPGEARVRCR